MKIASWHKDIQGSGTLAIKAKALELKAQGKDIIEFTAGEPDFPTPAGIKDAAKKALDDNFTYYTQTDGIPELKNAIIRKFKEDNHLDYTGKNIIVTCGAKHAIYEALLTILDPGAEVIIPVPFWVSYSEQVKLAQGVPVYVSTHDSRFKLTPEKLEGAITSKTRALFLNSPSNPTGAVYSKEELQALVPILEKNNIWVISDEIYEKIIFDGLKHTSISGMGNMKEQTIVINGFSKAYSMTGWRLGYAAGPENVIQTMKKMQGHQTSNVNSIAQKAGVFALTNTKNEIEKMRQAFEQRRNYIFEGFSRFTEINVSRPQGAFYLFPDFNTFIKNHPEIKDDFQLVEYMIEKAGIVAVPGSVFGSPGFLRFSYATSMDEIKKGLNLLEDIIK